MRFSGVCLVFLCVLHQMFDINSFICEFLCQGFLPPSGL
ncbi:hypothetical protein GLYMA_13G278250v4 [Glycine max]|nr:hypothetical protein GLYMA_13G278250v4 [Glycine max]KAH1103756.1 hypothetical protein GYH30_037592 [Glycine max]